MTNFYLRRLACSICKERKDVRRQLHVSSALNVVQELTNKRQIKRLLNEIHRLIGLYKINVYTRSQQPLVRSVPYFDSVNIETSLCIVCQKVLFPYSIDADFVVLSYLPSKI